MDTHYVVEFPDGTHLAWRPLTWNEYNGLTHDIERDLAGITAWLLYEEIVALCILDSTVDDLLAGVTEILGAKILEVSGFLPFVDPIANALAEARARVRNDWYESTAAVIVSTFHIPLEEIRGWTRRQFLDAVARYEVATGQDMTPVSEADLAKTSDPREYQTGPGGERIPMLRKRDLAPQQNIAVDADREAYDKFSQSQPAEKSLGQRLRDGEIVLESF